MPGKEVLLRLWLPGKYRPALRVAQGVYSVFKLGRTKKRWFERSADFQSWNFHTTKMQKKKKKNYLFCLSTGKKLSPFLFPCDFVMFSWRAEMSLFRLLLAPLRGGRGFSPSLSTVE